MTPEEVVLATASAGVLGWMGWVSSQLVGIGRRTVRVETKLENGLSAEVKDLKRGQAEASKERRQIQNDLSDHINREETVFQQLKDCLQRDPKNRTRTGDRQKRYED